MDNQTDTRRLAEQLVAAASPEQHAALLDALLSGNVSSIFEKLHPQAPLLQPAPAEIRGYRLRLDLHGAKPPVWRRIELPGDVTLPVLHDVIQAAMGWSDTHLHRFRTGRDPWSPYFVTELDLDEGEDGVLEDDVRLDQLVSDVGDELWYDYDFGDGWEHVLRVEKVLDEPPARAACTAGRKACPPEDCGGIWGYTELAAWVRSGYDGALLPSVFDTVADGRDWLGPYWNPDDFDVDAVDADLAPILAEPVAVAGELAALAEHLDQLGFRALRDVLARPLSHGSPEVTEAEAARLTETYRIFLEVIDDGVDLTGAGYLPPAAVERFAERSGIGDWWIGKANREDLTPPVFDVRDTARRLGLVQVRKRRLSPTAVARRCHRDPQAMWRHVVSRLPVGTKRFDRDAGWFALAVVGSGAPMEHWHDEIGSLVAQQGWRVAGVPQAPPPARSPTLAALEVLAGTARTDRLGRGSDPAVAATARAAMRRED